MFNVTGQLNEASAAVVTEVHQLDHSADSAFEEVNRAFQAALDIVEARREAALATLRAMRDDKKKVLQVSVLWIVCGGLVAVTC